MIRPEFLASRVCGATSEFFCFGKFAQPGQDAGEIVTGVEGFDLIGTAKLLGHAQIKTTERYAKLAQIRQQPGRNLS